MIYGSKVHCIVIIFKFVILYRSSYGIQCLPCRNSVSLQRKKGGYRGERAGLGKWLWRLAFLLSSVWVFRYLDRIKDQCAHGNDTRSMVFFILSNLTLTYPQTPSSQNTVSLNLRKDEWTLNNAGGAMGAMYIIHFSITEYLFIFRTPSSAEGLMGLHTADDYFNILQGEQWAFSAGSLEMEVYKPGSVHHLPRATAKQYKMHKGCFALEYARGWIPPMMPFGLADMLSSTLDFPTFYHTARITGREMFKNLLVGKI